MTFTERIKTIRPIPYSKYAEISSREKLVVYAMSLLEEKQIPLNFNNICIATFRLFPEKFYFSEEYSEYPHIEMLNRTVLHLRPAERNYAMGSVKTNYVLTELGKEVALQVKSDIDDLKINPKLRSKEIMDTHKKTSANDLRNIKNNVIYSKWREGSQLEEMEVWRFFGVTPFTQLEKIKQDIKDTTIHAKSVGDKRLASFLKEIERMIV